MLFSSLQKKSIHPVIHFSILYKNNHTKLWSCLASKQDGLASFQSPQIYLSNYQFDVIVYDASTLKIE